MSRVFNFKWSFNGWRGAIAAMTVAMLLGLSSCVKKEDPLPEPDPVDPTPVEPVTPTPLTPEEREDSLYNTIDQDAEVPKLVFTAPKDTTFKRIAYFPSYRATDASGMPDSVLDCLDIGCFAFGSFDANGTLTVSVPEKMQVLVKRMHAKGKKVLLSFKGTSSSVMGELVCTRTGRKKVINALLGQLKAYELDGIDNDWEYPSTSKVTSSGITTAQANLYLMEELSNELHRHAASEKLLTMAVTPGKYAGSYRDAILDELLPAMDWLNVMTYDDYSTTTAGINHASWSFFETSFTYWTSKRNFDRSKLVFGLPCYGRASGITQSGTTLSYSSILSKGGDPDADEAVVSVESTSYTGTYTIYYNGRKTIQRKVKYLRDASASGYFFWEAGQDVHDERSLITAAADVK